MRTIRTTCVLWLAAVAAAAADVPFSHSVLDVNFGFARAVFAIADINGDGRNDIVQGGPGNSDLCWREHPSLTKHAVSTSAGLQYEVHAVDVDDDRDIDIVTGPEWFENDGAGEGWRKHAVIGASGHDLKVGDIDRDGRVDVVSRGQNTGSYTLYFQDNPDSWTSRSVSASRVGEGTWLGDIDRDGDLDLSDGHAWFECPANPRTGTWVQHNVGNAGGELTRVVIVDLNADHRLDILSAPSEYVRGPLVWFEAPLDARTGAWTAHQILQPADWNFHTLQAGDMDLDGDIDIVAGTTAGGGGEVSATRKARILFNRGGSFSASDQQVWETPTGIWQAVVGDVGSDGDLDIVGGDYNTGAQADFWQNTLNPATGVRAAAPGEWSVAAQHPVRFDLAGRRLKEHHTLSGVRWNHVVLSGDLCR